MKKHLFLIGSLLATISAFSQNVTDAISFAENEQYSRSKSLLFRLIKTADKPEPFYQLGNVYLKLEKPDSALYYFSKAKEVDPKFNLALVGIGSSLYQIGKKVEAKANFDQALSASKNKNAEILARVAEVYVEAKDKSEVGNAISLLDKAILYNAAIPEYYLLRGDAYLIKQDGSKAVSDYHEAIRLNPKSAKAYIKEGKLYIKARNYTEALKFYNKGIEANPEYSPGYREMGELYAKARQYPKALESYKKYMALSDNDDDTKFRYASFLFMTQDYKGSKELINNLFSKGYTNKIGYRLLGYSDYEMGDSISALSNLRQFMSGTDTSKFIPSDYSYFGKALIKNNQPDSGMKYLEKAYALDSSNADLILEMAETANRLKNYPATINYYEKAAKKFKPRFNDLYNLGKAYYFEKKYTAADTTFGLIIANYPKYPYGYSWKGNTKAVLDPDSKKGLAKPYFEKVVELFTPESAKYKSDLVKAHAYLGAYYQIVAKDNDKASENWNKVLAYDPSNKQAKDALLIISKSKEKK
ncbi:MAG: tetratricopeptide repeat protein [Opitutaceae bacterium]|nr:tetratricopeptide repeat protein [Cytophagales bacterium]